MYFKRITQQERERDEQFRFRRQFNAFIDDFDIVAWHWDCCSGIEIPYFIRLIQNGSKARQCIKDRQADDLNTHSYHYKLFDHGAFWKTRSGDVICTGMPYSDADSATKCFAEMAKRYGFPDDIKFRILDEKYKYRPNGYIMTMVYKSRNGDRA